jgi:hypothetical protein
MNDYDVCEPDASAASWQRERRLASAKPTAIPARLRAAESNRAAAPGAARTGGAQ